MQKIVLASNNTGKIKEFQDILKDFDIIPQQEFNITEVEESGLSFVENAILKARNTSQQTKLSAIADDSGLVIPALDGEPGIYSARYSGGNDEDNISKVLEKMQNITERSAYFYCVIAYIQHYQDPAPIIGFGTWRGEILQEKRGEGGFGYDPIFYLPHLNRTSAELSKNEKNKISHRKLALDDFLKNFYGISEN